MEKTQNRSWSSEPTDRESDVPIMRVESAMNPSATGPNARGTPIPARPDTPPLVPLNLLSNNDFGRRCVAAKVSRRRYLWCACATVGAFTH
jgi:hypothetical protein